MIAKKPIVSAVSVRMWRMVLSLCCVGRMGLAPLLLIVAKVANLPGADNGAPVVCLVSDNTNNGLPYLRRAWFTEWTAIDNHIKFRGEHFTPSSVTNAKLKAVFIAALDKFTAN